jgi:hypothetical protein
MLSRLDHLLACSALVAAASAQQPPPGTAEKEQDPRTEGKPAPGAPKPPPAPEEAATQDDRLPPAQRPAPADAAALFSAFAAMPGLEVRFEEEKHLSLLALPLHSRGRLYFLPPAYLTRVVEAPEPSTLTITPDRLKVDNRDGVEVIDLKSNDQVRAFITSLVHVFAGDAAALEKAYDVAFTKAATAKDGELARAWTLTLTPRARPLDQMLQSLALHGEGEAVVRIELRDKNGDRTVTRVVAADPTRRFDAAEQLRLFGIQPK